MGFVRLETFTIILTFGIIMVTINNSESNARHLKEQRRWYHYHAPPKHLLHPSNSKDGPRPNRLKKSASSGEGEKAGGEEDEEIVAVENVVDPLAEDDNPYGLQFVDEPEIEDPILKHQEMYDTLNFYPPWTYSGFNPPKDWHDVPIAYFTRPLTLSTTTKLTPRELKQHRSAMHLCSEDVTSVMNSSHVEDKSICHEIMENECANMMPSPINILSNEASEDRSLAEFIFLNYDVFYSFTMFFPEDGTDLLFMELKTPKFVLSKKPTLTGGSLYGEDLYLDRVLFHIGSDRFNGSEHSIDGRRYGMEIQFFFTTGLPYWEVLSQFKVLPGEALEAGKKIHVMSVMVEVAPIGATEAPGGTPFNKGMEYVSQAVGKFWPSKNPEKYRAVQAKKKLITMEDFFSVPFKGVYYTYEGSLTHPPCLTGVSWSVFEKPIWISYEMWLNFLFIRSEYSDSSFYRDTYRPQEDIHLHMDLKTYKSLRKSEGLGDLRESELNWLSSLPHVSAPYTQFQKHFAKKVRKSKEMSWTVKQNEYDYYEF